MAKRDLSKPLSDSIFDPRDRNKDGVVDDKEKAYDAKIQKFKSGKGARDAKVAAAEAEDKMSLRDKKVANAKAKAASKKLPYPRIN